MLRFIFTVILFLIIYSVFRFIFALIAGRRDYESTTNKDRKQVKDSDTIELDKDQYKVD